MKKTNVPTPVKTKQLNLIISDKAGILLNKPLSKLTAGILQQYKNFIIEVK
jgi:hypothetical protein